LIANKTNYEQAIKVSKFVYKFNSCIATAAFRKVVTQGKNHTQKSLYWRVRKTHL